MGIAARRGFTLIELLVVIAIIAVLIALLVPAVQKVREAANRTRCSNNMRQVAVALHNYHEAYKRFPPGQPQGFYSANWYSDPTVVDADRSCWVGFILPYIEQAAMYAQYQAWLNAPNSLTCFAPFATTHLATLLCPSDPYSPKLGTVPGNMQGTHTNLVVCLGSGFATPNGANGLNLDGIFYGRSKTRMSRITDGTSNTLLVSELLFSPDTSQHDIRGRVWNSIHAGAEFSTLYPPNSSIGDNPQGYCNPLPRAPCASPSVANAYTLARSMHPGGVNVAFADGAVQFIANGVTPAVYLALGSRAGAEPVSPP
jgi:prepilin-type N-terminal cleavage/methylation domain-containing protein/prepilin-type processing-associated H-X9-DG protein